MIDGGRASELESYGIIEREVDVARFGPLARAVARRIVHATADPTLVADLVVPEPAVRLAVNLLRGGATVVVDSRMVAAGTPRLTPVVSLDAPVSATETATRAARAMRATLDAVSGPAIVAIGNAPTALEAVLDDPRRVGVVLGFCVGYVGAAEAKAHLLRSGLPALTLLGRRGGSPVAAAALNAIAILAKEAP